MSVMSELLHSLLTVLLLQFAIIFIVKTLTNKNQKISDFFYSFLSSFSPNIESNLPHPQSFPFVGNLLQLRVRPLETLNKWSKEYGPVYSINLGQKLFVILNNHEVVNELIVKGSSNYTFRYDFDNINRVLIKSNSLAMAPYGSEWKSHRLIVHNALLPRPITSYYGYITNEVNQLTNNILSKHSQLISPLQIIKKFVLKSMLNILFGDQIDESFFNDVMKLLDDIAEFSTPISVINDFIPVLDHIYKPSDLKAEKVCERMEQLFSSKYDQFLRDYSQKDKKLSPSILAQIQESNEKGNNSMDYEDIWKMLVSLLNKSFQTEVSTLMWTIACLANNPGVQQEAFSELDDACKNMPSMEEEVDLPYINAIINEALRYRPPNPFGFSHITNKDVDYRGYLIPKGTPLLLNLFAINHNEKRFITPDKFRPSRFLPEYSTGSVKSRSILLPQLDFDSNIETNGEEERLANKRMSSLKILLKNNSPSLTNESMPMHMSFGAGKRYCIGQHLAQKQMFLTIARILWAFEIKPGTGEDGETPLEINLDDGKLSLTSYFPNPYKVRFSLRKDISLLL